MKIEFKFVKETAQKYISALLILGTISVFGICREAYIQFVSIPAQLEAQDKQHKVDSTNASDYIRSNNERVSRLELEGGIKGNQILKLQKDNERIKRKINIR